MEIAEDSLMMDWAEVEQQCRRDNTPEDIIKLLRHMFFYGALCHATLAREAMAQDGVEATESLELLDYQLFEYGVSINAGRA